MITTNILNGMINENNAKTLHKSYNIKMWSIKKENALNRDVELTTNICLRASVHNNYLSKKIVLKT